MYPKILLTSNTKYDVGDILCSGNGYHRYQRHTSSYSNAKCVRQRSEVKQRRARLVARWVTQALEQGRLGSCAQAGYHQYYNDVRIVWRAHVGTTLTPKEKRREWRSGIVYHSHKRHTYGLSV